MGNRLFQNNRRTIGLLIDNMSISYTTLFWKEIQHQCQVTDVNLVIFPLNYSKSSGDVFRKSVLTFVTQNSVEGLIVLANTLNVTISVEEMELILGQFSFLPIVVSGIELQGATCSVLSGQCTGLEELLEHLILQMGCRNIAFVKGIEGHQHTVERFRVYEKMLLKYGIPLNEELIVEGDYFPESGMRAVHTLLDVRKIKPDAIVSCNDDMALGVIDALYERGIRIPQDILVTGYDNIPEIQCEQSILATVSQPIAEMAQKCFSLLAELLEGKELPKVYSFSSHFVWRESAGIPDGEFVSRESANIPSDQRQMFGQIQDSRMMQALMVEGVYELMSTQTMDELLEAMEKELPRVKIHTCFMGFFDYGEPFVCKGNEKSDLPEMVHYLWGYRECDSYYIKEDVCYPTKEILPTSVHLADQRMTMILEPLFQLEQAYGFLFYELNMEVGSIYETVRQQICSAMKTIYLLKEQRKTNYELTMTLDSLRATEQQLIESEKMAALGTLVAGVAHEINTPIGVSVSASSFLAQQSDKMIDKVGKGALTKKDFEAYLNENKETCNILLTNLERATELIRSFKNIAVDQTSEEYRLFVVKDYLEQVILSLHPKLKKKDIRIQVDCPKELAINSFPGAFSQIITNFVINALVHAFADREQGVICITVKSDGKHMKLKFADNGCGIPAENLPKLFDPFFTTKRGTGGAGLGLHIVYNLVTHKLKGQIQCQSTQGEGTIFYITIPVTLYPEEV